MKILALKFFLFFSTTFLLGCSTYQTLNSGIALSREFSAPFEAVVMASRYSIETLNVKVRDISKSESFAIILFEKPANLWGWGEIGKVTVERINLKNSLVSVRSEKRSTYQVTGTNQDEFADAIFDGVEKGLKDLENE